MSVLFSMQFRNVREREWSSIHYVTLAFALRDLRPHNIILYYIILRGVVYAKYTSTNSVYVVVGSGPWKNHSNGRVRREKEVSLHCPGQNAAVSCKNYRRSYKYRSARPAEERRKSDFGSVLTCSSRKLCIDILSIFDHKSVRLHNRHYLRHTESYLVTPVDHAESTYLIKVDMTPCFHISRFVQLQ